MGYLARDLGYGDDAALSAAARSDRVGEILDDMTERAILLRGFVVLTPAEYDALHDLEKTAIQRAGKAAIGIPIAPMSAPVAQPAPQGLSADDADEEASLARMQSSEIVEQIRARRDHFTVSEAG